MNCADNRRLGASSSPLCERIFLTFGGTGEGARTGHRVGSGMALLLLLGCQVQFDRLALICEGRPTARNVALAASLAGVLDIRKTLHMNSPRPCRSRGELFSTSSHVALD